MCSRLLRAWLLSALSDGSPCYNKRLNWVFTWVIRPLSISWFSLCKERSLLLISEFMDGQTSRT